MRTPLRYAVHQRHVHQLDIGPASWTSQAVNRLEAKPLQLFGIALPVLGDLDVQVEVDSLAEQRFDPLACSRADLAKTRSTLADDDGLLAGALDEDVDPHVEHRGDLRAARACQHLLHLSLIHISEPTRPY